MRPAGEAGPRGKAGRKQDREKEAPGVQGRMMRAACVRRKGEGEKKGKSR